MLGQKIVFKMNSFLQDPLNAKIAQRLMSRNHETAHSLEQKRFVGTYYDNSRGFTSHTMDRRSMRTMDTSHQARTRNKSIAIGPYKVASSSSTVLVGAPPVAINNLSGTTMTVYKGPIDSDMIISGQGRDNSRDCIEVGHKSEQSDEFADYRRDHTEDSRVQFMCNRLQKSLLQKEKLRISTKNVKLLQNRLKQQQAILPPHEKLKPPPYDSSQYALNSWLRDNPLGKKLNGAKEIPFRIDLACLKM